MKVSDIVKWTGAKCSGNVPESCGAVSQDTRTLGLSALYVALRGENADGHNFVADALARGAAAALVSDAWKVPPELSSAPLLRVRDPQRALWDIARNWRQTFAMPKTRIVGLTGSSGKTTTREMIAALLAAKKAKVCATSGNFNNHIGLPLSILSMKRGCDFGVFETGVNHPGEMDGLADILRPDAAVVTNIGTAHIEFFETQEAIAREKGKLLAALPEDGFAVMDVDTACFDTLRSQTRARIVTVSSAGGDADYSARLLAALCGRARITERATGAEVELTCNLPGEHNAADLLLAYAVARECGIPADACPDALEDFSLPGMRWKVVQSEGVVFINDAYNANPQSMEASIRTFMKMPCRGRRVLVLGDMFELGSKSEAMHRAIGALVAELKPDLAVFVGNAMTNAATEARERGMPASSVFCADGAANARLLLAAAVRYGDAVLLKASRGMGLEQVLQQFN
jgi:UDP-N-acetylmuramoyl-tripeptide--D-alanyl-D-alanine ligase